VAPAKVVILGGGVSGTHAAEMAGRLRATSPWWTAPSSACASCRRYSQSTQDRYSTAQTIEELVRDADLVIGAVLIAAPPRRTGDASM